MRRQFTSFFFTILAGDVEYNRDSFYGIPSFLARLVAHVENIVGNVSTPNHMSDLVELTIYFLRGMSVQDCFNVRAGRDLHRRAIYAKRRGINLNTVVNDALRHYLVHPETWFGCSALFESAKRLLSIDSLTNNFPKAGGPRLRDCRLSGFATRIPILPHGSFTVFYWAASKAA